MSKPTAKIPEKRSALGESSVKTDSTRERILLKAGPVFASKGFRATTVREICDSAEVNVASINYYFGDKHQLYIEAVVLARQMRVEEVPYPDWGADTPPKQKLTEFIGLILERLVAMESEPWQVQLLMREIQEPTDACRHLVKEYFKPFFEMLLGIVDDIIGVRLEDHRRSQIGFSIIGQCLYYRFASDLTVLMSGKEEFQANFDRESLAKHITQFSLSAIESIKQEVGKS